MHGHGQIDGRGFLGRMAKQSDYRLARVSEPQSKVAKSGPYLPIIWPSPHC